MRTARFLSAVTPLALLVGLTGTASADVYVLAEITKKKDVTVTETLETKVDVDIEVDIDSDPSKGSKSLSLLNQRTEDNWLEESTDYDPSAALTGSVKHNKGLTSLNQAAGHQNSQGNSVAAAFDPNSDDGGFAEAQASSEQQSNYNDLWSYGGDSTATITGSVNGNEGVTSVNQAAGHQNQQGNAIGFALAYGVTGVALAESDLGQFNTHNYLVDSGTIRIAKIEHSINGNLGITSVNQASGAQNNQMNTVSFAAVTSPTP